MPPFPLHPKTTRRLLIASALMNVLVVGAVAAQVIRKGGWSYLMVELGRRPAQVETRPFQANAVEWFRQLPRSERDTVFLGDSLTADTPFAEVFGEYKNRGIGGDTTANILQRVDEAVRERPARMYLMMGTNDIAKDFTTTQIIDNYRAILRRIHEASPGTKVFVEAVLPTNNGVLKVAKDRNPAIAALNAELQKLAGSDGATWLDLTSSVRDPAGNLRADFTTDGLHLNSKGKLTLCDALRPYVKPAGS